MESGVVFNRHSNNTKIKQDEHTRLKEKISELEDIVDELKEKLDEKQKGGSVSKRDENPTQKGHQDSTKEDVKNTDTNKIKIDNLVAGSEKNLIEAKSPLPSFLYLDKIAVDINKTSIIKKGLLNLLDHQVFINTEIKTVTVTKAILFAAVELDDGQKTAQVKFLKPSKAEEIKKIIDGIVVAKKQQVDLAFVAQMDPKKLKEKFEKIGN